MPTIGMRERTEKKGVNETRGEGYLVVCMAVSAEIMPCSEIFHSYRDVGNHCLWKAAKFRP